MKRGQRPYRWRRVVVGLLAVYNAPLWLLECGHQVDPAAAHPGGPQLTGKRMRCYECGRVLGSRRNQDQRQDRTKE